MNNGRYYLQPDFENIFLDKKYTIFELDMYWLLLLVLQSNAAPPTDGTRREFDLSELTDYVSIIEIDSSTGNIVNDVSDQKSDHDQDYINAAVVQNAKMLMRSYENTQIEIQNDMFGQLNEINRILDETKNMRKTVYQYYLSCITSCIAIGVILGLIGGVIMEIRKLEFNILSCCGKIILLVLFIYALMVAYFITNFFYKRYFPFLYSM